MNKRNSKLKLSVRLNLVLKALNMLINFALVPMLLAFLGKRTYGIWVTIYAFIAWLNIFDVGLGQGLKLKLTEAFSTNQIQKIKKLISSAYYFVAVTSTIIALLFSISYFFFDWSSILDIQEAYHKETNYSIAILVMFFLSVFIAKLIGVIYESLQLPFVENLIKTLGQLVFLILLFSMTDYDFESNLIMTSIFSMLPLLLMYLLFTGYFFRYKSPSLLPRIKNISKCTLKEIIKPSVSFFVIQIGYIVLYSTDNLIIINLLSEEAVTDYHIYYKYYSIPFLFFNIYLASHGASFIDAFAKKDFSWIKKKIKLFNKLFLLLITSYIILFFFNEKIMELWIGEGNVTIDNTLGFYLILYYLISSYAAGYIYVVNSYGKLYVQLISYIFIAIINIPLSIFFVKFFDMGSEGVLIASIICLLILLIIMPIQYLKIVNQKVRGIWNK
ncbi:MAG: hypothetical protein HWD85_02530 [Flavobacteriaceae bacterium]|nr:hypothetical protein [Flavobacteriaceae bacterium]